MGKQKGTSFSLFDPHLLFGPHLRYYVGAVGMYFTIGGSKESILILLVQKHLLVMFTFVHKHP